MKRALKTILFILTALLLFLPMLQEHLKLLEFRPLTGVVTEDPQPKLTMANFMNHRIQRWTETYIQLHYGLREPLTRLHNQFQWDVFHASNALRNKRIYRNDDGWIFESPNMEEYYRGKGRYYASDSAELAKRLGEEALRIYQVQQILEANNTHLLVLLLPGKELIYPEHIPQTNDFPGEKQISAWEFYGKRFKELGVNHFDVGSWFLQIKDSVDYLLYPQTGTHWSNYASMYVADSLIRYMEQLGDMKITHFDIGERYVKTVNPDDDLEQLMNLMRPLPKEPNYFADTKLIPDSTADHPKVIAIGDSYFWNIANATPFGKAMDYLYYWYYFSTVYFDGRYQKVKDVDVMEEVLDADFVILSFCTPQLYEISRGFTQQLLIELCCDNVDLRAAQNAVAQQIRWSKGWLANIEEKANEYEVPLDSAIMIEADNCIRKRPTLFIPILQDTLPTHRSERYERYQEQLLSNLKMQDDGIQQ